MGTKRQKISDSRRVIEGIALKSEWDKYKAENRVTQDQFCAKMGINQGMLQQMFSGKSPIPFETLLELSIEMGFDPRAVRPEIDDTIDRLITAIQGADSGRLRDILGSIDITITEDIISQGKAG
tara:strand:- start:11415 stop:11786 length:372 start_codon:yes stop_codon:yes gene_type:complete